MNTFTLRFCLALTIIFSAASGFAASHYGDVNNEYYQKESEEEFIAKFLQSERVQKYFAKEKANGTEAFLKEALFAAKNTLSFSEYMMCFNQSVGLESQKKSFKNARLARDLCSGSFKGSAAIGCVKGVLGNGLMIKQMIQLCKGAVYENETEQCFLDKRAAAKRSVSGLPSDQAELDAKHDEFIADCAR